MEVYCQTCGQKKPMRRIRKPRGGRWIALFFFLLSILTAVMTGLWPVAILLLALAAVLASYGRNYWQCEACGRLTERV